MKNESAPIDQVIIYTSVFSIVFVIGLYVQMRVIKILILEKTVAWETQIYQSIVLIIYVVLVVFSEVLLYIIPDSTNNAGWWLVWEISRYLKILCVFSISWHTLSVSLQKYIVIVHNVSDNSDRRKIAKTTWWVFLIIEIFWSAGIAIRGSTCSSVDSYVPPESCYSRKNKLSFTESFKFPVLCTFNNNSGILADGYFIYFMTQLYCTTQFIIHWVLQSNIIEALIYFKIFQFSKR